jgi:hypothetical protein
MPMLLNPFRVDWRNSHYCQSVRCVTRSRIKIASLGISCGKSIDRVLVLPFRDAASCLSVSNCLLAIAKSWIRNGELVLALPYENLCANIERWPEFWIRVQGRIHGALRTGHIAIFQLIFRLVTQVPRRADRQHPRR